MKKKQLWLAVLAVFLFVIFSPAAYAAGLSSDTSDIRKGETFTANYSVANRVENVGAITLYIDYDSSVLRATSVIAETTVLSDGQISCVAPTDDDTGIIVVSWTEPYCSMVLEPEENLLSITFEVLADAGESRISSKIIVKGNNSSDGIGNDDLSGLTGAANYSLVLKGSAPENTVGTPKPSEENNSPAAKAEEKSESSDDVINNTRPAPSTWLIAGIAAAALIAVFAAAVLIKRKKPKQCEYHD